VGRECAKEEKGAVSVSSKGVETDHWVKILTEKILKRNGWKRDNMKQKDNIFNCKVGGSR
jgi:hypothetical protein